MTEKRKLEKKAEEERVKALVAGIYADFEARRAARKPLERSWELNVNFFEGNQYCDISPSGEIDEEEKQFYWQTRRVFNQIAPIVDTRCSHLNKNMPSLHVRPFSDEPGDVASAAMAEGILNAASEKVGLSEVFSRATMWSEICGTAFYKVVWDRDAGEVFVEEEGARICAGDVDVLPVSPFEIFPDSLSAERMEDLRSIIQARAVPVAEIYRNYRVELVGKPLSELAVLSPGCFGTGKNGNMGSDGNSGNSGNGGYELLIERYTLPDEEHLDGRLEIVAGGKLLYEGNLPYWNGERSSKKLPFVRQISMPLPGSFFGASIVDRLIPLQRAYNAVRNRKQEFLNRLSVGVLTVEDGSVDVDELAEEGLCPGKIIVYRQGTKAPEMMDVGGISGEFLKEEEELAQEFKRISGINESGEDGNVYSGVTSATGLQLLLSREEEKIGVSIANIRRAAEDIARQILRLYKQFATTDRLARLSGENRKTEVFYFNAGDISSEDIRFDSRNDLTAEAKRTAVLELLNLGLLKDEDGNISRETKEKIAAVFGVENLLGSRDITSLHVARAGRENLTVAEGKVVFAEEYDDHAVHVREHLRYLLSEEFEQKGNEAEKIALTEHIARHRALQSGF